jgi:hypothetical protein
MHTQVQLKTSMFDIQLEDEAAGPDRVFPDWVPSDRFGIIIDRPLGGVGASHLIQLAIAHYYSATPERLVKDIYPEIYAFHAGRDYGSHMHYDFWPPRREIVVPDEPGLMLAAINDRAITRLALPEGYAITSPAKPKELVSLDDVLRTAYEYSATGRVANGDLHITGLDKRTEVNPSRTLSAGNPAPVVVSARAARRPFKESDPEFVEYEAKRSSGLTTADFERAKADRDRVRVDAGAAESYRALSIDEVIRRMGAAE